MTENPPIAARIETKRTHHGDTVIDPYAWLKDPKDPETLAYLKAENAYTDSRTSHLAGLRETLFGEIKNRVQETDLSVPTRVGDWWYYSRSEEGKQYAISCRLPAGEETAPPHIEPGQALEGEEILLDGNALAEGHDFFSMGVFDVSPDGNLLAYGVDFAGDERFTLRFKDLRTGEHVSKTIEGVFYGGAWSADSRVFFYVTVDEAWRPDRVWRHTLGSEGDDVLVYHEEDERFWVGISLSRSEKYLMLDLGSKLTAETRILAADNPEGEFTAFGHGRRQGIEVHVEHQSALPGHDGPGRFFVLHNDGAENFELGWTPEDDTTDFHVILPHSPTSRLEGIEAFESFAVVSLRSEGLTQVGLLTGDETDLKLIEFDEPIYSVSSTSNPEYRTNMVRLGYTSLVAPASIYDYEVTTGQMHLRKETPVLGDFNRSDYRQYREWATAADGTKVPISIVAHKDVEPGSAAPCLLYGYGSYEMSIDPYFSTPRLSLLDRGVVFAIAHIRGGGEMGRAWYDNGKMLKKKNTFTDYVDCAHHLIETGWTSANKLVARGGSAGGMLMGAVANLAPSSFAGVLAEVPFVDSLNTILDPTMPLTVIEWEEWGNPLEDPDVYAYMKSYSPYENVAATEYPSILAVTSLNDTRVGFHEPAKWVAQLRHTATGGQVLLKTEMEAGHGGRSGRYDAWHEESFNLAWILDQVGLADK
ncbi:S9 family peptidase [Natronoglycomyces albus]|uniref:S9 family peptidase n=1 Tax=Natronoglycomyces albus TaxID=2811108 RepID=A0A895XSP5_9ACTN|nr:S9 family peptidase [Natronoglycomyces albus]QSB05566.1 S9 family peptidase [Natronoglycomyces albus]